VLYADHGLAGKLDVNRATRRRPFLGITLAPRLARGLFEQIKNRNWQTAELLIEHFGADDPGFHNHEASLVSRIPDIPLDKLNQFLDVITGQICLIVTTNVIGQPVLGTGFLVGPDLVLTCNHVLKDSLVSALAQSASHIEVYFDFYLGGPVKGFAPNLPKARRVALAANWHVASSPSINPDGVTQPLPPPVFQKTSSALDFVLFRLAEKVGLQTVDRNGGRRRQWVDLSARNLPQNVEDEDWVIIPQHPDGQPQRIDMGRFRAFDCTRTRLRYDTNTAAGSSGAPCFNQDFQLLGVHNAYVGLVKPPILNQAISATCIAPLVKEHINEVAADITPDILPKLAGAAEDFPEDSEAASFLASRTATTRLSPPRIRSLTPKDALFHFRATAQTVFGFDDLSVDQVALEVSERLSENRATIGAELLPWAQTLWIKTGIWRDLGIPKSKLQNFPRPIQRASLFWAARSAPHHQMEWKTHLLEFSLQQIAAFVEDSDLGFRGATQTLALARGLKAFEAFALVDERIARMISGMKPNPKASTQAALRTAIVLGDKCRLPAIDLWLKGRRHGARDRVKDPTFSSSELRMLARIDADAFSLLENWGQAGTDGFFRIADDETVSSAARILEQFLASPLDQFAGSDLGRGLARVFACRDEDWIIPFGYAAERLAGGIYPDALRERISDYASPRNSKFRASVPAWSDMLGAMRIADEAGDLQGFAQQILDEGQGSADARADLLRLLQSRDEWARKTDELIGRFDGIPEAPVYDAVSEPPPAPGPILDKNDPQRGRWGGKNEGFGRTLKVVLESVESKVFFFSLIVESTDGTALEPPAVFHLHDTFPRSIIHIRRIVDGKLATLNDWSAYGVFTVGVQVKDGKGMWISLELNLASIPKLPARFLKR